MKARDPLAAAIDPYRSSHSIFRRGLSAARGMHGGFVSQDHHVAVDLQHFEVDPPHRIEKRRSRLHFCLAATTIAWLLCKNSLG